MSNDLPIPGSSCLALKLPSSLNSNQIININHLSSLIDIMELGLSDNQITDSEPITNLSKLKRVDLSNNPLVKEFICPLRPGITCKL
jgi:Leucine-rich repeat (LRR) protein